ncbi:hypothetical protein [Aequorivita sp. CIP111184]|uniref:hypothetical protein n=1 Tax=Aequorivita sp. CIP111184 TaxID=2211356 RepID=UPI000DBC006D|nr:hypothetical protein [Aequorivita sp. CIP111184]SRX55540.1 hypothetical protein AEQU1_02562 [Aequorivita sp. CIP111184]
MTENMLEEILQNPSGIISEKINIQARDYEVTYTWERRIHIKIKPYQHLIDRPSSFKIRKSSFASIIFRTPQYSLRGNKTALSEKLLSNQYTRALLYFPNSKIIGYKSQIAYTAELKKKNSDQLEIILNYFKALLVTL